MRPNVTSGNGREENERSAQGSGAPLRWTEFLHAGQVFVSSKPNRVLTILGSCVSVCLWEAGIGVGGMNHFLLPRGPETGTSALRFGNGAVMILIEKLQALGCRKRELRAKVFGGAHVLEVQRSDSIHLGEKNAEVAFRILEAEQIPVIAQDVGGCKGRKLMFSVADGYAWVKRI